ncbi:hypothetical protein PVAND_015027 [Polypedilum vanderplanki]|uniref:Ankyrin repeat protein n=1 Tax=Polypedilum vanderplanki TaxID=319348 RepID=A0A9J6BAW9_POLVA|nr:hypothetical protein PVAND_015027 [Polypedilum vanderplanki]
MDDVIKIKRFIKKRTKNTRNLKNKHYIELKELLSKVDVNTTLENGTLLHLAVEKNLEKLFQILLDKNGDVTVQNNSGESVQDMALRLKRNKIAVMICNNKSNNIKAGDIQKQIAQK